MEYKLSDKKELTYLTNTLTQINKEMMHNQEKIDLVSNSKKKLMKDERNNIIVSPQDSSDIDDIITAIDYERDINNNTLRLNSIIHKQKILDKMKDSPYFGRFDFVEKGCVELELIYLGLSTLYDDDNNILIYDWRTPISSMFYDYGTGSAFYTCPAGKIEGEIKLKKQYKIENSKLIYYFDSDIKIDDNVLKEILSNNADGKMKNIVKTIQKKQNLIVRNEENNILIVYGPAGSGKTSVGMHRIAYLLYRFRNTLTSKNVVILSPNSIFSDYIKAILPELGETNIKATSLDDYFFIPEDNTYIVENKFDQMEYILNSELQSYHINSIKFKTSFDFLNKLIEYTENINKYGLKFFNIKHNNEVIFSAEKIENLYTNDYNILPCLKRLKRIKIRILEAVKSYKKILKRELKEKLKTQLENSGEYMFKREFAVTINSMYRQEMSPVFTDIDTITSPNIINIYINFYKQILSKDVKVSDTSLTYKEIDSICSKTINNIKQKLISYEDISAITFIKSILNGFTNDRNIKHVIIDEAQDYTPIQIEFIKNIFRNSKITILGDLNQQINQFAYSYSPNELSKALGEKNCKILELSQTFRSTSEISAFCSSILSSNSKNEFFDRNGEKPLVINCSSFKKQLNILYDIIIPELNNYKSFAIITKNVETAKHIYENLNVGKKVNLIKKDDIVYKKGISIIPSYLSKGLEFDFVIVISNGKSDYQKDFERNIFYTVCSRALHKLVVLYINKPPVFLNNIDKNLYLCTI